MEKLLLEEAERNKSEYQYKLFSSRKTILSLNVFNQWKKMLTYPKF